MKKERELVDMTEKNITFCNKILYYLIAPALLVYFFFIDTGIIKCSLSVSMIFLIIIIGTISIHMVYKKKNNKYKFEVSSSYGKIMMVLVFFELCFNFYK